MISIVRSAGAIRLILRIMNAENRNAPLSCSLKMIEVIKKPEMTKKTSTPAKPRYNRMLWMTG